MIRQFELVERVQSYDPDADEDMLNRAYVYGLKKHGTQMRASGDPYFSHPVEVAGILAEMKLDTASIVTGLLHDTIEDTDATREEIERLFGESVARLVDGVTKLSRLELQSESTKEAENLRKLVLAMSSDIRVLLVKLADRLHNMRTLHHIKDPARRRRIAHETMDIYAPLASRIGMERVKRELEELAFAELNPDGRASVLARLDYLRERGERLVPEIEAELIKTLKEGGLDGRRSPAARRRPIRSGARCRARTSRSSSFPTSWRSASSWPTSRSATRRWALIHGRYQVIPGRFKDYISVPKPNGYRSLHTGVIGPLRPAHRDADPHRGDAGPGRARRRRPLDLQAGRAVDRRAAVRLAAQPDRHPRQGAQRRGIPRAHQARDVPRPGVLLHAQGQADRAAARRDADRLRLRRAQPGRRHLRRLQDQRPHAAAAHAALQRRPGRDHHLEGADAVADLGALRRHRQGQGRDPPLHPHAPARAVPAARQVAARQDLPRGGLRGHREGPRRRARQLQAGHHRRPDRRGRRRPRHLARGA